MAINQLAAALVLTVISGSVLADVPSSPATSSSPAAASAPAATQGKTRAQVIAELQQARANGEMDYSDASYPGPGKFVSTKTRAQVLAELKQARANGELEYSDNSDPAQSKVVSTKTRAEVIAELKAFQDVHGMNTLYRDYGSY